MRWFRRNYVLVLLVLFFVAVNIFFYFISPAVLVEFIGIKNSYLILFVMAATAGLSTFTGSVLLTSIYTFSGGGLNPFILGLVAGLGIFISDSIFFALAQYGRQFVPEKWESRMDKVQRILLKHPPYIIYIFIFIYLALTPLPNDLLMLALVIGGYKYKQIVSVLLLGSIGVATNMALIGRFIL